MKIKTALALMGLVAALAMFSPQAQATLLNPGQSCNIGTTCVTPAGLPSGTLVADTGIQSGTSNTVLGKNFTASFGMKFTAKRAALSISSINSP